VRQAGGKIVYAWAVDDDADADADAIKSNTFSMEWPQRSGACGNFPKWIEQDSSISRRRGGRSARGNGRSSMSWRGCWALDACAAAGRRTCRPFPARSNFVN
jgi:hypothetical protein